MNDITLGPCPFCGNGKTIVTHETHHPGVSVLGFGACVACGARGPTSKVRYEDMGGDGKSWKDGVANEWNTRTESELKGPTP